MAEGTVWAHLLQAQGRGQGASGDDARTAAGQLPDAGASARARRARRRRRRACGRCSRPSRPGGMASVTMRSAMARKASAAGPSPSTTGSPASPPARHGRLERDLAEQRHAGVGGQLLAAALAEEGVASRRARR